MCVCVETIAVKGSQLALKWPLHPLLWGLGGRCGSPPGPQNECAWCDAKLIVDLAPKLVHENDPRKRIVVDRMQTDEPHLKGQKEGEGWRKDRKEDAQMRELSVPLCLTTRNVPSAVTHLAPKRASQLHLCRCCCAERDMAVQIRLPRAAMLSKKLVYAPLRRFEFVHGCSCVCLERWDAHALVVVERERLCSGRGLLGVRFETVKQDAVVVVNTEGEKRAGARSAVASVDARATEASRSPRTHCRRCLPSELPGMRRDSAAICASPIVPSRSIPRGCSKICTRLDTIAWRASSRASSVCDEEEDASKKPTELPPCSAPLRCR